MNIFFFFETAFQTIIDKLTADDLLPKNLDVSRVVFELPREASHGDLATNAAMVLAKQVGSSPRELAKLFAAELRAIGGVTDVKIAGPGFLNIDVEAKLWTQEIVNILSAGLSYGKSEIGDGKPVNIEFVSANPTGPLHVGHGRGAAYGDAIARILTAAGSKVEKEYYINDAGRQIPLHPNDNREMTRS